MFTSLFSPCWSQNMKETTASGGCRSHTNVKTAVVLLFISWLRCVLCVPHENHCYFPLFSDSVSQQAGNSKGIKSDLFYGFVIWQRPRQMKPLTHLKPSHAPCFLTWSSGATWGPIAPIGLLLHAEPAIACLFILHLIIYVIYQIKYYYFE